MLNNTRAKTISELAESVAGDPELAKRMRERPAETLASMAETSRPEALQTDKWIYRIVVGELGLAVLVGMVGAILIVMTGEEPVPDVLVALGSAAVGALAGLLAPSPPRSQ